MAMLRLAGLASKLPVADAPGIDVDEVGARVKSYTARLHVARSTVQRSQLCAGQANVYGLAQHVQAALGHAGTVRIQLCIGGR